MRVIINADDLGISKPVNDAIFDLMARKLISSATILANAPAVEDAAARLSEFPDCSFGVHLNITEFKPLSNASNLRPLLSEGAFIGDEHARAIAFDATLKQAVLTEWKTQIEVLRSFGISISHIDSHHHMHTHPPLFGVLKQLQRDSGITKVRKSQNVYTESELGNRKLHLLKKALWNFALRHRPRTTTTDLFTKYSTFVELGAISCRNADSIELMVHPGHANAAFRSEIEELESHATKKILPNSKLISYNEL